MIDAAVPVLQLQGCCQLLRYFALNAVTSLLKSLGLRFPNDDVLFDLTKRSLRQSPSRMPLRSRSMPMRTPEPDGTPVTLRISPAAIFACNCVWVNGPRPVLSVR